MIQYFATLILIISSPVWAGVKHPRNNATIAGKDIQNNAEKEILSLNATADDPNIRIEEVFDGKNFKLPEKFHPENDRNADRVKENKKKKSTSDDRRFFKSTVSTIVKKGKQAKSMMKDFFGFNSNSRNSGIEMENISKRNEKLKNKKIKKKPEKHENFEVENEEEEYSYEELEKDEDMKALAQKDSEDSESDDNVDEKTKLEDEYDSNTEKESKSELRRLKMKHFFWRPKQPNRYRQKIPQHTWHKPTYPRQRPRKKPKVSTSKAVDERVNGKVKFLKCKNKEKCTSAEFELPEINIQVSSDLDKSSDAENKEATPFAPNNDNQASTLSNSTNSTSSGTENQMLKRLDDFDFESGEINNNNNNNGLVPKAEKSSLEKFMEILRKLLTRFMDPIREVYEKILCKVIVAGLTAAIKDL